MENEINKDGEQPTDDLTLNVEEQQTETKAQSTGSPIYKFKSVEALGEAYQNLEKEFTQKCQKIKELTDKLNALDNTNQNFVPEYQKDDWPQKVLEFFASHQNAKQYIKEISEVISTNADIANGKNILENALTKVLADKYVSQKELAEDEEFLENYIYSNKKVGEKIIDKYLDGLSKQKAMPLISSSSGAGAVSAIAKKPTTIKDAGKLVEAYLKNK